MLSSSDLPLLPTVTSLWQQVLQSTKFTADTHFFLAGGDSLQLTRVMLKLQQACGIRLQLRDVTEFSTPRKMAAWCEHLLQLPPSPDVGYTPNAVDSPHYTASAMQQGLWLAEQRAEGVGLYNTAALLHLQGSLETAVLEQALSVLLHKHPVVRSRLQFDLRTRSLQGFTSAFEPVFLRAETVTACHLPEMARQMAALPFALHERMYRFHLFKLASDHHALLLCCHHAVTDMWSAGVMLQSLAEAYNKLRLDPAWQARDIDTEFFRSSGSGGTGCIDARTLAWWKDHLGNGTSGTSLQPATRRTICWPFSVKTRQTTLDGSTVAAIAGLARRHQVTPFSVLLTALKLVLAGHMRVPEQLVGFPVAGRDSAAQENSVGCYVNTLLTRDYIDGPGLSAALLRRVHAGVQGALLHAMPLQQLIRHLHPVLLPDGNAWFDVLFAFQNLPARVPQFHGLRIRVESVAALHGQYPLKLEVVPGMAADTADAQWQLRVEYAPALFDEEEITDLVSGIQQMLGMSATG